MAIRHRAIEGLSGPFAIERKILALSRPHGVVARDQLVAAGISSNVINNRVAARWLRPIYRGVYAVGPVQSDDAPHVAAVLACGERAVLSHRSAAVLWRLVRQHPDVRAEVTVPLPRCPAHSGVRIHRVQVLRADEVTRLRRVPVTTPARTLLDIAPELPSRGLEQALAQAERMYAGTQRRVLALLPGIPVAPARRPCVSCSAARAGRRSRDRKPRSEFSNS